MHYMIAYSCHHAIEHDIPKYLDHQTTNTITITTHAKKTSIPIYSDNKQYGTPILMLLGVTILHRYFEANTHIPNAFPTHQAQRKNI